MVVVLVAFAPIPVAAQDAAPRTPWGRPDLQGVWDFLALTPMQRPSGQVDREFLTDAEAASRQDIAVSSRSEIVIFVHEGRFRGIKWDSNETGKRPCCGPTFRTGIESRTVYRSEYAGWIRRKS